MVRLVIWDAHYDVIVMSHPYLNVEGGLVQPPNIEIKAMGE